MGSQSARPFPASQLVSLQTSTGRIVLRDLRTVCEDIATAIEVEGVAQVPNYAEFKFLRRSGDSLVLLREKGTETKIPFSTICKAIDAVRNDQSVYLGGPSRLREFGITHVNSPTWALLRLLPLNKLID